MAATDTTKFDEMLDSLVRNANQDTLEEFAAENIKEKDALNWLRDFATAHKLMLYYRSGSRASSSERIELKKRRVKAIGKSPDLVVAVAEAVVEAFKVDLTAPEPEPEEKPKKARKEKAEGEPKAKRGRPKKKVVEEEEEEDVEELDFDEEEEEPDLDLDEE